MAFKSANLKLIYEERRATGRPMDASQVARLFRQGQISSLLMKARRRIDIIHNYERTIAHYRTLLDQPDLSPPERDRILRLLILAEKALHEHVRDIDDRETWY